MRQNPNPKKAFPLLAAIPAVHQRNRSVLAPIFRSRFCREAVQQMPQSHLGYPLIEHIIFKLRTLYCGRCATGADFADCQKMRNFVVDNLLTPINHSIIFFMEKLVINSYEEFESYLGKELGISEWLEIDQDRINKFADATLDHQWIHVDVERAKQESPFKSTIAHGYLTLSVLPYLWQQIIQVNNISMLVNYGMDKMKFGQAVITGSRVRMSAKLHNIQNLRGIAKVEIDFKIEIEGQRKPALQGISSFLYHFNQ